MATKVVDKLLSGLAVLVIFGAGSVVGHRVSTAWPDEFPITFGMSCRQMGGDPATCSCIASGIMKQYTPQEFVGFTPELPSIIHKCTGDHVEQEAPPVPDRSI